MSQTTTCLCILSFVTLFGCAEEKATLYADGGRIGAGAAKDAGGTPTGRVDGGIDAGRVDAGRSGGDDDDDEATDDDEVTDDDDSGRGRDAGRASFVVTSPSFVDGDLLPEENRCADAVSPALSWSKGPAGTKSYAVQLRNPTGAAGQRSFWQLYDLPADVTEIPAALPTEERLDEPPARQAPDGSRMRIFGYRGPCTSTESTLELTVHALDVEELPGVVEADNLSEDRWIEQIGAQIADHQIGEPARIEVKAISIDD